MLSSRRYLPLIVCINVFLLISAACAYSSISLSQNNNLGVVSAHLSAEQLRQLAKAVTVKVRAGESQGSGFVIAKSQQTYRVITNAHVVDRGAPFRIETFDGKIHTATLISKGDSFNGNDLATLEFQAPQNYIPGSLGNTTVLAKNERVFAAGFPYESGEFTFSDGKISLIAAKPLRGGYQIGFTSETHQGMSGGPLFDEKGKIIGVLGQGSIAILEDVYTYKDGSRPDEQTLEQMRSSSFAVPAWLLVRSLLR
jgi:S1-C subfamily serine protease